MDTRRVNRVRPVFGTYIIYDHFGAQKPQYLVEYIVVEPRGLGMIDFRRAVAVTG